MLAVQFDSLRLPFLVVLGMPFCIAGMGCGLRIAGQPFGTTVIIGIILCFVPLDFALESGGELLRPMAAAAIGGLILEVLVALFLVPVFYTFMAEKPSL
ncbi:MAG: hypothetical protein WD708_01220 [Kiritimatiellia bacterium]